MTDKLPQAGHSPWRIRDAAGFYYKVPGRAVYCNSLRGWLAELVLCHVVYRLAPLDLPNLPN